MFKSLMMLLGVGGESFGLDIGSHSIKFAQVRSERGKFQVTSADLLEIPQEAQKDETVRGEMIVDLIKGGRQKTGITAKNVVLSVSSDQFMIVRNITLLDMPEKELRDGIKHQVEDFIPFGVADAVIDFSIVGDAVVDGEKRKKALMAATQKSFIENIISYLKRAGVVPIAIEPSACSLLRTYEVCYGSSSEIVALVDIGVNSTALNIVDNGTIQFSRTLEGGSDRITQSIMRRLRLADVSTARNYKHEIGIQPNSQDELHVKVSSAITSVVDEIASHVRESIEAYRSDTHGRMVDKIIVSGGGAKIKGLVDFMSNKIGIKTILFNPFINNISISTKERKLDVNYLQELGPRLVTSIGLAIRGVKTK